MARIRTIKPSFWAHEELSALPEATHILAAALLNYADDHGYFNANVGLIRAACTPLREPSVSIPESLRSLQTINYIRLGSTLDGKRYGQVVKFDEHQKVSHPTDSKIATLSITWDVSGNDPENFRKPPESLRPEKEGNKEEEREGNKDSAQRAVALVVKRETTRTRGTRLADDWRPDEQDRDYARSFGWTDAEIDREGVAIRDWSKSSRNGVKLDWHAAWRTWVRRKQSERPIAKFAERESSDRAGIFAALAGELDRDDGGPGEIDGLDGTTGTGACEDGGGDADAGSDDATGRREGFRGGDGQVVDLGANVGDRDGRGQGYDAIPRGAGGHTSGSVDDGNRPRDPDARLPQPPEASGHPQADCGGIIEASNVAVVGQVDDDDALGIPKFLRERENRAHG